MSPDLSGAVLGILFDSSLRVLAVAALVAALLVAARVRAGNLRHAAWAAVLAAMLLMPVLTLVVPAAGVRLPAPWPALGTAPLATPVEWTPEAVRAPVTEDRAGPAAPESPSAAGSARTPAPALPRPAAAGPGWPSWRAWLVAVYVAGLLAWLARFARGWRAARRVVASARPIAGAAGADGHEPMLESDAVSAPVVVGAWRPRILLPAAWRTWQPAQLRAVLAHERAHARRRDASVAFAAHLNRCLFWFHPVAWWLERALAEAAEQAADAEAVRAAGEPREYARVLVDMADAVRKGGRRLRWQGVGVDGSGMLGNRIDRILSGNCHTEGSTLRKGAVLSACASVVLLVAACRPQPAAPPPLRPDPDIAQARADQARRSALVNEADAMTAEQVRDLEARVAADPQDFESLRKLLVFYRPVSVKGPDGRWVARCSLVIGEQACIEARRPHILRIIRDHPDHELAGEWGTRIFPTNLDPLPDPAAYGEATKLWLAHLERKDVGVQVLRHAASFFEVGNRPLAEEALRRAAALDPTGGATESLGRLYYLALVGSSSSTPLNVVRTIDLAAAHGPHASKVRERLRESTDARLLAAAAWWLVNDGGGYQKERLDFDAVGLGRACLDRALALDPGLARARALRVHLRERDRNAAMRAALGQARGDREYRLVSALSERERFEYLPWLCERAYMRSEYLEHEKRSAEAATAFELASNYARDLLALVARFEDDPDYGTALFRAHVATGLVALRHGDRPAAVEHLQAASNAPASEGLAYGATPLYAKLVNGLLKAGERDTIVAFLERYAALNVVSREQVLRDAERVRKGLMTVSYQHAVAQ